MQVNIQIQEKLGEKKSIHNLTISHYLHHFTEHIIKIIEA